MKKKVRALQCVGINNLELTEFDYPSVEEDCALLKIHRCGICGTDLHGIHGLRDMKYPFIPGHELVATVVDMGRRANKTIKTFGGTPFQIGDRVTINPRIVCGSCFYCQNIPQRPEMCINARTYNSSITSDIPPYLFGGWAEYMYVLPGSEIIKVPDGLSDDRAVLAEPFACAIGCIDRYQREHDWIVGDAFAIEGTVVVYGVGAIGMLMIAAFHLCGAKKIIAVDMIDEKLGLAKEFGATDTINADNSSFEERYEIVKSLTDGIGAHIVIEACGVPSVITEGVKMLRRGGKLFVVGHLLKSKPAEIDPQKICRNELEILGNYAYPSSNYFYQAFHILSEGRLQYDKMTLGIPFLESKKYIIHKMPKSVKVVIEM